MACLDILPCCAFISCMLCCSGQCRSCSAICNLPVALSTGVPRRLTSGRACPCHPSLERCCTTSTCTLHHVLLEAQLDMLWTFTLGTSPCRTYPVLPSALTRRWSMQGCHESTSGASRCGRVAVVYVRALGSDGPPSTQQSALVCMSTAQPSSACRACCCCFQASLGATRLKASRKSHGNPVCVPVWTDHEIHCNALSFLLSRSCT